MLRLEQVTKHYNDFSLECSMEVKKGYITGLIGANGAGKSTTFKAILNLIHLNGGEIILFGKNHTQITNKEKEQIGVVLADSGFSQYLTIKDYIPVLENIYEAFDKENFVRYCKKFRLPLDKKIKDFSTGMRRKLQIIAALTHEAKLLILDEPTAGLDVTAREDVLNMLREYMETEDRAILISSHISSDLENLCDDFYVIDKGKIILHEETDVLLSEYAILKLTKEEYDKLDKSHIIKTKREGYGMNCLTREKQFYQENYPEMVIEKGTMDELLLIMIRGEE